jgi:hypothetical protein
LKELRCTERHATIRGGCPLDLTENMLLVHSTWICAARGVLSIKMLWLSGRGVFRT